MNSIDDNVIAADVLADLEEVCKAAAERRPVEIGLRTRVRARADAVREQIRAAHGIQDIGVAIIHEIRDDA